MKSYAYVAPPISEMPREFLSPLYTYETNGCPDDPLCAYHTDFVKQQDAIEIHDSDLISDSGQEIYNFLRHERIELVLLCGTALNMCMLGRAYGIIGMKEIGMATKVVRELVEVAYSPSEPPRVSHEQALELMLNHVAHRWCPIVSTEDIGA